MNEAAKTVAVGAIGVLGVLAGLVIDRVITPPIKPQFVAVPVRGAGGGVTGTQAVCAQGQDCVIDLKVEINSDNENCSIEPSFIAVHAAQDQVIRWKLDTSKVPAGVVVKFSKRHGIHIDGNFINANERHYECADANGRDEYVCTRQSNAEAKKQRAFAYTVNLVWLKTGDQIEDRRPCFNDPIIVSRG